MINDWKSLFVKVAWIVKDEFTIEIPDKQGKLTNVRAATIYEEHLPFVQEKIVNSIANAKHGTPADGKPPTEFKC